MPWQCLLMLPCSVHLPREHPASLNSRPFVTRGLQAVMWKTIIVCVCGVSLLAGATVGENAAEQSQKLLSIVLKNPRFGTTFDRLYAGASEAGTLVLLQQQLDEFAGFGTANDATATDKPPLSPGDEFRWMIPAETARTNALLLSSMIDLRHSKAEAASDRLQQVVKSSPENGVAFWYLARSLVQAGRTSDAVPHFEQAANLIRVRADLLELYREYARSLLQNRQPEESLRIWQRLEKLFPDDRRVAEQIARWLAQDGRWTEALDRFQKLAALTDNPEESIGYRISAADMLIQLNRDAEARTALEQALETLDPQSWRFRDIRQRIESLYRKSRQLQELAAYFDSWLKIHPDDTDAMMRLASVCSELRQMELSSQWMNAAVSKSPRDISVREFAIRLLLSQGMVAEAIQQYEELEQIDQGNIDHREAHGLLYLQRADLTREQQQQRAEAVWESLIEQSPQDPVLLSRIAGLMVRAGLEDRAAELYRQAIDLAPDQPQYREYLGELLHRRGRSDEAVSVWNEIAAPPRRTADSLVRLAEVLRRFGHLQEAVAAAVSACELESTVDSRILASSLFAELSRSHIDSGQPAESRTAADNALKQLDLAEKSAGIDQTEQLERARVSVLEITGRLAAEAQQLSEKLSRTSIADSQLWGRLATYYETLGDYELATQATLSQLNADRNSIGAYRRLTDLYERTGRLGDAVSTLQKLTELEPRNRIEFQRRMAKLDSKLGRHDAAIAAGEGLVALSPGDPDAYRFLADLAFAAGKPDVAVNSLRKGVRVSPGDVTTLKALGKLLADEFQTGEAIEIYWKALESASDSDSQLALIPTLSQLYLRSNRFDELIERLQRRGRELGLEQELSRTIATAWKEAGEFSKARELLEQTLAESENSLSLLMELATIASLEHNRAAELSYRIRILRTSPRADDAIQLIRLISSQESAGEVTPELKSWLMDRAGEADCRRVLAPLFEAGFDDLAMICCHRLLQFESDDWFALLTLSQLLQRANRTDESLEAFERVLSLQLRSDSAKFSFQTAPQNALPFVDSLHLCVVENTEVSEPETYGDACSIAVKALASSPKADTTLAIITSNDFQDRVGLRPMMTFIQCRGSLSGLRENERTRILDSIRSRSNAAAAALRLMMNSEPVTLTNRPVSHVNPHEQAQDLLTVLEDPQSGFTVAQPMAAADSALTAPLRVAVDSALKSPQEQSASERPQAHALLAASILVKDLDLLELCLEEVIRRPESINASRPTIRMLISGNSTFLDAARRRSGVIQSLLKVVGAARHQQKKSFTEGILTVPHRGAIIVSSSESLADDDEHQLSLLLQYLLRANALGASATSITDLISSWSPFEQAIVRAELSRQEGDRGLMLKSMIDAARIAPNAIQLRLWISRLASNEGASAEALQLLASMKAVDPAQVIQIEQARLDIARFAGDLETAKDAAVRLAGLPLLVQQRLELVPALKALGLERESAALEARMEHDEDSREVVLTKRLKELIEQGQTSLAGEVAWEMLRIASGGSLFSGYRSNDDLDDGGARLQALKQLANLGRLQELIQRYREMLKASPDSVPLLETLAELEEAAYDFQNAAKTRDRIAVLQNQIPRGLKDQATELENNGNVKAACEIYLQICRDSPSAFAEEMETYYQAFERAGQRAEFLAAVLATSPQYWEEHGRLLINVVADAASAGADPQLILKARDALLAAAGTRRQAIASFLARGAFGPEEDFLPAMVAEFEQGETQTRSTAFHEYLLLLSYLKKPSNLEQLRQQLLPDGLSTDHQNAARVSVFLVISARLPDAEGVAKASDIVQRQLQASVIDESKEVDDVDVILATCEALRFLEQWRPIRRRLLETVQQVLLDEDGRMEPSIGQLLEVYREMNLPNEATKLTSHHLKTLLSRSGTAPGSVRQILQAAEQIQHSGFPVEAWQLLNSVTATELDSFTADLERDKATAFQSRFNAARRWSEQKMTGEPIVGWIEQQLSAPQSDAEQLPSGLMMELQESSTPGSTDSAASKDLRLDSPVLRVLPRAIQNQPALVASLSAATSRLSTSQSTDLFQLSLGIVVSDIIGESKTRDLLIEQFDAILMASGSSESPSASIGTAPMKALGTSKAAAIIVCTRWLATHRHMKPDIAARWIRVALANARRSPSRPVRRAVLHEAEMLALFLDDDETKTLVAEFAVELKDGEKTAAESAAVNSGAVSFDLREAIRQLSSVK